MRVEIHNPSLRPPFNHALILKMNAVIDIGNTFAKIGWFEQNELLEVQRKIPVETLLTVLNENRPTQAIFSSTSHQTQPFAQALTQQGCQTFELTAQLPVPLKKDYETPQTLGPDRVAAAVGAMVMFPNEHCLIIDMGTCVTYDWLSADAVFGGGIISPGLRMRFQAMHSFTKKLPLVEADGFPMLVGKNTQQAMQSGAVNGLLAEAAGIIARYHAEMGNCKVLLCGGDAPFFESRLKKPIFAVPNLVLIGLNRILQYNVSSQKV